jgi:succinyl-CoA synthetase beta subunit
MRLLEYQGKELFLQYGIPTPRSALAASLSEVEKLSSKFEFPLILKSQVAVGGRGKAVKVKCDTQVIASKFTELITRRLKENCLNQYWWSRLSTLSRSYIFFKSR